MSFAAAKKFIEDSIKKSVEWRGLTNIRAAMNSMNIHSLNLSYAIFKENNNYTAYKFTEQELRVFHSTLRQTLHSIVNPKYIYTNTKSAAQAISREELLKADYGCLLISNNNTLKIVGYEYRAVRELLTLATKNNRFLDSSPLGRKISNKIDPETGEILEDLRLVSKMHLGHTGLDTPLIEKVKVIISEVSLSSTAHADTILDELNTILQELTSSQRFLKYSYINTSSNSKLGSGVLEMVVQPEDLNLSISTSETKLERALVATIQKYIPVLGIPGSNTLAQDTIQFVNDRVLEGLTGKSYKNIKPHAPVKSSIPTPAKASAKPIKKYTQPLSQLRNTRGQFYSLASLQNLLNSNLAQKIQENMGTGGRRDVLNYRTGRLANSAKVERMSQSREGMITAFYTYMRNPYGTFSEGGAQSSPKSRDPKLLISKSIREIAATQVSNRMRAVLA